MLNLVNNGIHLKITEQGASTGTFVQSLLVCTAIESCSRVFVLIFPVQFTQSAFTAQTSHSLNSNHEEMTNILYSAHKQEEEVQICVD